MAVGPRRSPVEGRGLRLGSTNCGILSVVVLALGAASLSGAGGCTPMKHHPPMPSIPAAAERQPALAPAADPIRSIVDPVAVGTSAAGITAHCDHQLGLAREQLAAVQGVALDPPEALTFEATLGALDRALLLISNGADYAYLLGVAHPDDEVRQAARRCESRAEALTSEVWLDWSLALRVEAFAAAVGSGRAGAGPEPLTATAERAGLTPERVRFVRRALRELRRRGALLGPHAHERLRRIDDELTSLGQQFVAAITSGASEIRVPASGLEGLPASFRAAHPPAPDDRVTVTTRYPDYYPFVTYAEDRELARQLYVKFVNRGGRRTWDGSIDCWRCATRKPSCSGTRAGPTTRWKDAWSAGSQRCGPSSTARSGRSSRSWTPSASGSVESAGAWAGREDGRLRSAHRIAIFSANGCAAGSTGSIPASWPSISTCAG